MSERGERTSSPVQPPPWPQDGKDPAALPTLALCLVIAATTWFLLKEFASVLRPLLLAVLVCYAILPAHRGLKQRMPSLAAVAVLAGASVVLLYVLALLIFGSAVQLSEDLPQWIQRAQVFFHQTQNDLKQRFPWLLVEAAGAEKVERPGVHQLRDAAGVLAGAAADVLAESMVVGVYLLFLLLEVRRFPDRVRSAFPSERADQILGVADNVSRAMASYLKVKVKASLILAVPVTVVLWVLGVKFAFMWGVLTFIANFIPYLGSVIACSLPIVLAFLQMEFGWRPIAAAVGLVGLHTASAYLIEPRMIGKAVSLSPLVILLSLAFWGLCWGLIGMVLAVPLTVMLKMVLENVAITRPLARLMGE